MSDTQTGRIGRPEGVVLDGDLLRNRRTELGLSQGNVADIARLGLRTVRTAEQGVPVSPDTARLIAQTLGLAYVEVVRPPPEMARSRLLAGGLAPLPPPEPWVSVPAEALLADALATEAAVVVCVEGPSGIGKSALVRKVIATTADRWPDGAVWVAAAKLGSPDRLARLRADIADCLGFAARLPDPAVVAPEAFDIAFRRHLWHWRRLVVLDDLEDPDLLRTFADATLPSTVVVTTHSRWVADHVDGKRITLEPWAEGPIRSLLGGSIEAHRLDGDPDGTKNLLELVGGLPLHAHLAGTSLRRTRHQTPGDYTARVRTTLDSVQTFSGGAMPSPGQEPFVIHLLERLGGSLPSGALIALRDLAVFGDQAFSIPWAVTAIGRPAADVRALLDALGDAWLLRTVGEGAEARIVLDERALAAWGQSLSTGALRRLLEGGPALLDEIITDPKHNQVDEAMQGHLPAFRRLMDLGTARTLAHPAAARTPADVPKPKGPHDAGEAMGKMLVQVTGLLRLHPPREAGAWITAALSVANEKGTDDGKLAWLLAWWWFLGDDLGNAAVWAREAARLACERGPTDLAVSMSLHAALIERANAGMAAAAPHYAVALELSRRDDCPRRLRLGAAICQASSLIFSERGNPRWAEAMALLERAAPEGALSGGDEGVLESAALANLAVCRAVLGAEPIDPARVVEGLDVILRILNDSEGIIAIASAGLAERLGGTWPRRKPKAADVFASGERLDSEALLTQVMEMAAALGAPSAPRVDDSLKGTPVGHLYSWTVEGFPMHGRQAGAAFELILPLEPMKDVLVGEGRGPALRFVTALRGPDHAAAKALRELHRLNA